MGLARLFNMKLDQPTKQYLAGLGITKNTANSAMVLRGLGFSLNDIAVILRSDGAKQYDLAKGERELSAEEQGRVHPAMIAYYNLKYKTDFDRLNYHRSKFNAKGRFEKFTAKDDEVQRWFESIKDGKIDKVVLRDLIRKNETGLDANLNVISLLHYTDINQFLLLLFHKLKDLFDKY